MAEFWENDPVVEEAQESFWVNDPVVTEKEPQSMDLPFGNKREIGNVLSPRERQAAEMQSPKDYYNFLTSPIGLFTKSDKEQALDESIAIMRGPQEKRDLGPVLGSVVGVSQGVGDLAKSFTSPVGLATLGTGALPSTAAKIVSGVFAADMARHVPEVAQESGRLSVEGTAQEQARAGVGLGGTIAFAGLAGSHAFRRSKAELAKSKPVEPVPVEPPVAKQEPLPVSEVVPEVKTPEMAIPVERTATPEAVPGEVKVPVEEVVATPEAPIVSPFLRMAGKVKEFFRQNKPGETPPIIIDETHVVPRLQPYGNLKQIASNPQGMGAIPVAGKLADPRYGAVDGVDKAIITRAYSVEQGRNLAALWAQGQSKFKDLFPANKDGTFQMEGENRGYLSDVLEAEQANPGSQRLTPEQRAWLNEEFMPVKNDINNMLKEEGVLKAELENGDVFEVDKPYFPRPAMGKVGIEGQFSGSGGSAGRPGSKPFSMKSRLFESEQAGVTSKEKLIYDPDPISRVTKLMSGAYRSVADKRLAMDPDLQGKTVSEVFSDLKSQFKGQRELLSPEERAEFDAELRDRANHPVWLKQKQVYVAPAFQGRIFPVEVAKKLESVYGQEARNWIKIAESTTAQSKAFMLSADMGAPFIQGLGFLGSNPARWAKSTVKSYRALLDPEVMSKTMQQDKYKRIASEFVQSGGSLFRLQDFMSGAGQGLAGKTPIIKQTGRAFGVFMDLSKMELWDAYSKNTPKEQWPKLAESIETSLFTGRMEQIGITPLRAIGERLLMTAPSYYRGAAGNVATSFMKGTPGKVARRSVAGVATATLLPVIGAYFSTDMSDDEIAERLDPSKGKFAKVPIPVGDGENMEVGFGNVLNSVIRLLGNTYKYANSDKPMDTGVENNPFLRFLRAKAAFLPSLGIEMATGEDFMGNKIGIPESIARRFTPIVVQQLFPNQPEEQNQKAGGAIASFVGLQSFPESEASEKSRAYESQSIKDFKKPFNQLSVSERASVIRKSDVKDAPATPQMMEAAMNNMLERREKMRKRLSPESLEKLSALQAEVPSYKATLRVNGQDVPMTKDEVAQYESILAVEIDKILKGMDITRKRPPEATERELTGRLSSAREQAKIKIIRAINQKAKSP